MIITELLAGLSVATKAALGISMATAAAVTAGGAAGVLPGPAQGAVATTVEAVTPFSFPDGANAKADFGGTVATDKASGGTCTGSATSNVASVAILPGQGALGADIADITAVAASTSQGCGAAAVQSSSVASVTLAGVAVAILPGINNQVINVPGVATVYANTESQGSVGNPPSVDVVKIAFPNAGALSAKITGTVTIGHAQQSCLYS